MLVSPWTCNNLLGHVLFVGVEMKLSHDSCQLSGLVPNPDGDALCAVQKEPHVRNPDGSKKQSASH